MEHPLIEEENKQERLVKSTNRVLADELAREKFRAEIEFSRKPRWMQAYELGVTTPGVDEMGEFDRDFKEREED